MDSYSEVRRLRTEMSKAAGHDVRRLIESINQRRPNSANRIIDPGSAAERQQLDSKPMGVAVADHD